MVRRYALVLAMPLLLASGGCAKLKSAIGKGDGGASSSSSGGLPSLLSGFEGEVDFFVKSTPKSGKVEPPLSLSVFIKPEKVRLDLPEEQLKQVLGPGGKAHVVLDTPAKKLYVVIDPKQQVIVVDLDKTGEQLKHVAPPKPTGGPAAGPTSPPPKLTKTGKTDKVAGYSCEEWEVSEDKKGKVGSMCIAEQGASFLKLPLTGVPTEHAWMLELLDGKHFPLRFIGFDNNVETARLEVTKLEKKSLPASTFEIPAAYKVVTIEQFMQGMMAGAGGGRVPPQLKAGPR